MFLRKKEKNNKIRNEPKNQAKNYNKITVFSFSQPELIDNM